MKKYILCAVTSLVVASFLAGWVSPVSSATQGDCQLFQETGKSVCGKFLNYWNAHGGLPQQGFPISEELQQVSETDGKTYTLQYFERAAFEFHPENKGTPYEVLLSLLGSQRYLEYYGPDGASNQRPSTDNPRTFRETGHTLGGLFHAYWEQHGGLPQQGYPISDEFQEMSALNGKTYTVQYFERAVFEYHPENKPPYDVLLTQLDTFSYRTHYGALALPGPSPPDIIRNNEQASDRYFMWTESRATRENRPNAPGIITPLVTRALDLATQQVITVTDAPAIEEYSAISGSIVVGLRWGTDPKCPPCAPDVIGKDLSTGATYTFATGAGYRYSPQVMGRTVAWIEQDERLGLVRIITMDIDTRSVLVPFTRTPTSRWGVTYELSAQYLVWIVTARKEERDTYSDVQAYNFRDGQTRQLAYSPGNYPDFSLSGHYLLWQYRPLRMQDQALYLTNLDIGKTTVLTQQESTYGVAVRGNTLLWSVVDTAAHAPGSYMLVGMKQSRMQPVRLLSLVSDPTPKFWIAGDWLILKENNIYKALSVFTAFRNANQLSTPAPTMSTHP